MSAQALKIRGVPYSSMTDVEVAITELAADMVLIGDDDDARDGIARHIGDLLSALPDDRASELLAYINSPFTTEQESVRDTPAAEGTGTRGRTGEPADIDSPPVCPLCNGDGWLDVEPPQDPTAQRCPGCDGYGLVYTGSRVPDHATRACPVCMGRGFTSSAPDAVVERDFTVASATPEWPGALWNRETLRWDKPEGDEPWPGATWNDIRGAYEQ